MKRLHDWEPRLQAFVRARQDRKFEWGIHDCGTFVADAILAMTGEDLATEVRHSYTTEADAVELLGELTSGAGLEMYATQVAERNSMQEVSVKRAQRGDMVFWNSPNGPALGIVSLDGMIALFARAKGMERIRVLECDRAWRV